MGWIDRIPLGSLLVAALVLGLAPFAPEPHLWQKLKMLAAGSLTQPMDIFDLILHGAFPVVLGIRLVRLATGRRAA